MPNCPRAPSFLAPRRYFFARKSCPIAGLILCVLLFLGTGFANEPWDKQPETWNLSETYKILQDSPWSPAKSHLAVSLLPARRLDPLSRMPSDSPVDVRDTGQYGSIKIAGMKPLPQLSVLWWSSKTVRLAQQRLRQLREPSAPHSTLQAKALADFVVVLEGSDPLRILQDATNDLHQTVYLELPSGMVLDTSGVEFHEGEKGGEDYVAFHFPRQIEGRPTITPNAERVVFHCKASAKTERPDRPDSISVRVVFEPKKMRAAGQPDL